MEEQNAQRGDGRPARPAERSSAARQLPAGHSRAGETGAPQPNQPPTIPDGKISIDDFAKVELRVAQVKTAERVKGADKLLRLEVDLGTEVRQLVAGIAEAYAAGSTDRTQGRDRGQPGAPQTARPGIKRHDRRRLARRRQAGAGQAFWKMCRSGTTS